MKNLVPALLLLCGHASAAVVLSDNTFNNSSWTAMIIQDQTPDSSGTFTAGHVDTGGNPGAYREMSNTGSLGHVFVAHLFETVYNPSTQGAITSLDFSFDYAFLDSGLAKPPDPLTFGFGLFQNGKYYLRMGSGRFGTSSWATDSETGLVQGYLTLITNISLSPDFSATGGPIKFAYSADYFSPVACTSPCGTGAVDNWSVTINAAQPSPAPEPATWLLLAPPLLYLARRRRAR